MLSLLLWQSTPRGAYHLMMIAFYVAVYALPLPVDKIRRVALWLSWPMFVLTIITPFANSNVLAMLVWSALFFSIPPRRVWVTVVWFLLATVAMITTKSEGGLLALVAGLLAMRYGWRGLVASVIPAVVIFAAKAGSYGSVGRRVDMFYYAWQSFLRKPLGHGLGTYEYWDIEHWGAWHSHNLFTDAAYMLGIGGLAALVLIILLCWRANKPRWTIGFMIAFLVHSMVDGPLWYAPGLLLFITLKEVNIEYYLHTFWGDIGRYVRRYRFGPAVAAETSVSLDTRPADPVGAGRGN